MENLPKKEWLEASSDKKTDLEVMRTIVTGTKAKEDFGPNKNLLRKFNLDVNYPFTILDFGAGMMRETVGLLEMSEVWSVTAYDPVTTTLKRGQNHFQDRLSKHNRRIFIYDNWEGVKVRKFDCIICILVLQHIDEFRLTPLLNDFTKMTNKLCVFGRRSLDDFKSDNWTPIWPIIQKLWSEESVFAMSGQPASLSEGGRHDHIGAVFHPRQS